LAEAKANIKSDQFEIDSKFILVRQELDNEGFLGNGIIGLAFKSNMRYEGETFLDSLKKQKIITDKYFTFNLFDSDDSSASGDANTATSEDDSYIVIGKKDIEQTLGSSTYASRVSVDVVQVEGK